MRAFSVVAAMMLIAMCFGVGCHDDDDDAPAASIIVGQPPINPVWEYNVRFFGKTVRWPDGNIYVRFPDADTVQLETLQRLIDEINQMIAPACRLAIVPGNHIPGHHQKNCRPAITIESPSVISEFNSGVTQRLPISDWRLTRCVIRLGYFNEELPSKWPDALKRELVHALGFCYFTEDGGVMDAMVRNGTITPAVRDFLVGLYSVPPGSDIGQ